MRKTSELNGPFTLVIHVYADEYDDHPSETYKKTVKDIEDASKQYCKFRDERYLGGSLLGSGSLMKGSKEVAHVSYNGKVWEGPAKGSSVYDRLLYSTTKYTLYRQIRDLDSKIAGGYAVNNRGRKLYDAKGHEAGEKDLWRMRDMRTRAQGDDTKLVALARQMAKSIKDAEKAYRRADAAAQIFTGKIKDQIVEVFMSAAEALDSSSRAAKSKKS